VVLQVDAPHDGLRQSASEYEATIRQLQSELAEVKEQHQEASEEVGLRGAGDGGKWYGMYTEGEATGEEGEVALWNYGMHGVDCSCNEFENPLNFLAYLRMPAFIYYNHICCPIGNHYG